MLIDLLVKNPFYPHWLEFKKREIGENELIKHLRGKVIEVGCGNSEIKTYALKTNKKIKSYLATDAESWDENFLKHAQFSNKLGKITERAYGPPKDVNKIDVICDAMDLPFKKNTFDGYICFGVLEHIPDPDKLFLEANRILKKEGVMCLSTPFLYRDHGGEDMDFQRYTKGGYRAIAKKYGFIITKMFAREYIGSTITVLVNQYIIRKIMEGNLLVKIILLPLSPFIFLITNVTGYLIDSIDRDERFSLRYFVIMKKTSSISS